MKNVLLLSLFGIVLVYCGIMNTGCKYNNEEDLYPFKGVCDTTATPLGAVVEPILVGNCYGCHSASAAAGAGAGINLEDFNSLQGWALNGRLVTSIEHTGCCPMPKGGARLPECQILQIKTWVARGAQNN